MESVAEAKDDALEAKSVSNMLCESKTDIKDKSVNTNELFYQWRTLDSSQEWRADLLLPV